MRRLSTSRAALVTLLAAGSVVRPPAARAEGDGPPAASVAAEPGERARDGRRTTRRLLANLGRGFSGVWSADSLPPFLAGAAATAGASFADEALRDAVADPGSPVGKGGQVAGGAAVTYAVAAGLLVLGRKSDRPRFRAATYDLFCATVVNQAYTHAVKLVVGRDRPNGDEEAANSSFPSGHAANAFAWAAVLERHYGWKGAVPAYAVASVIGVSRIQENKHWLSDVVGGATLGYLAGGAVVRVNGDTVEAGGKGPRVAVAPVLGPRVAGLRVSGSF